MNDVALETVERPARWQFSLRSVLLLMVVVAALSALYRAAPQLDVLALGTAPAIVCGYRAIDCWRKRRRLPLRLAAVLLPSCALLYVVSLGPAIVLTDRFPWCGRLFGPLYAPLEWLYRSTPLHGALGWYADFWNHFWI